MRSKMTNEIFRDEMTELYIRKDVAYKESVQTAKEALLLYIQMLESGTSADPVIEQQLRDLSHALESVGGKHTYGYLPKPVKVQVDAIVERLAQLQEVAACYECWWQLKDEIAGYYGRNTPPHQPLTQQKEFRAIKNFIIREADSIHWPAPKQMNADTASCGMPETSSDAQPMPPCICFTTWDVCSAAVCRSSHLRCGSTPSAAGGCRRSAWPWVTSGMSYFGSIYADQELSHRAKTVYMYLKDRSNADGTCWPSVRRIAEDLKLSRRTVQRALADLERHGFLERTHRRRPNGSLTSNFYRLK